MVFALIFNTDINSVWMINNESYITYEYFNFFGLLLALIAGGFDSYKGGKLTQLLGIYTILSAITSLILIYCPKNYIIFSTFIGIIQILILMFLTKRESFKSNKLSPITWKYIFSYFIAVNFLSISLPYPFEILFFKWQKLTLQWILVMLFHKFYTDYNLAKGISNDIDSPNIDTIPSINILHLQYLSVAAFLQTVSNHLYTSSPNNSQFYIISILFNVISFVLYALFSIYQEYSSNSNVTTDISPPTVSQSVKEPIIANIKDDNNSNIKMIIPPQQVITSVPVNRASSVFPENDKKTAPEQKQPISITPVQIVQNDNIYTWFTINDEDINNILKTAAYYGFSSIILCAIPFWLLITSSILYISTKYGYARYYNTK